jgi:hypothetical protein
VGRHPDVQRTLSPQFLTAGGDVLGQLLQPGPPANGGPRPPCAVRSYQVGSNATFTDLGLSNDARSKHPGGVNVDTCDGSVRLIKNSVSIYASKAIASSQGGEVVGSDAN